VLKLNADENGIRPTCHSRGRSTVKSRRLNQDDFIIIVRVISIEWRIEERYTYHENMHWRQVVVYACGRLIS